MDARRPNRKPDWLKVKMPKGAKYATIDKYHQESGLHTVCRSAACPNRGECWSKGTATFLILGNQCTRSCRFCNIEREQHPAAPDPNEPAKVATAINELDLTFAVITSVTRDDLTDGGSQHFCETIHAIRERALKCQIEVLIPDFGGDIAAIEAVTDAAPDVIAHNIETVPRLYSEVRGGADYSRSLDLLKRVARAGSGIPAKSGIMLGLGETKEEVLTVCQQIADQDCSILTIGQYLAPSRNHLQVQEYIEPELFNYFQKEAMGMGFSHVESGPLVRSSYLADEQFQLFKVAGQKGQVAGKL